MLRTFVVAFVYALLSMAGCAGQQSSRAVAPCGPALWVDGDLIEMQVTRKMIDSNGADESDNWNTAITIDQKGHAIDFWGVIAEADADSYEFGSDRVDLTLFRVVLRFSGSGDADSATLVVHGDVYDGSDKLFYSWDATWTFYFGSAGVPFAPSEPAPFDLPVLERLLVSERIDAAALRAGLKITPW